MAKDDSDAAPPKPLNDDNRLGGRLKRYAQVSTSVGGLAAKVAAQTLFGSDADHGRNAADFKAALGGLKGPLMKVAQILATIPDALPDDYVAELSQLQSNAPPMGWLFVKRRMAAELGPDWQRRFGAFEREACAAASLGQVHKATSRDGRPLACKLQYPDMASAVEADLRQLGMVFSIYRRYDKTIDPSLAEEEIGARLREELDYAREARHMTLYRLMLDGEPGIRVPRVETDLSTGRLLTMEWLQGRRILDFKGADAEVRGALARRMFRAWYVPFFRYGVIHGDPHLGNYSVAEDGGINLMDFGCVRIFDPKFIGGVIDLFHAIERRDKDLAIKAYTTWGFGDLSAAKVDALNLWADFLFEAWLDDRVRPLQARLDYKGPYGAETAKKVHGRLRDLGGVRPPREFVFMDRAALGLGGVFMHLKAETNWHRLIRELMEDYDEGRVRERQRQAMAAAGLLPAA